MGDIVGRLFREFAVTLAVTIVISAVVSLTLTPMMCARILRHDPRQQQTRFYRWSEGRVQPHDRLLRPHPEGCPALPDRLPCSSPLATLVLTVVLYIYIPKGFFPVQDTGVIQGISPGRPVHLLPRHGRASSRNWPASSFRIPAVESLSSFIGADGTNTTLNSGRISINLKPLDERHMSASDVIRRLQPSLAPGPGHHAFTCSRCRTSPSTIASAAPSTSTPSRIPTPTS